MQAFRNLPVARKFLCAFGLVAGLCALLGAIALAGMAKINTSSSKLAEIALPSGQAISDMESAMQIYRRADMGILQCDSAKCVADYIQRRQTAAAKFRTAQGTYAATVVDSLERALVEGASSQFGQYQEMSDGTVAALQNGQHDGAAARTVGEDAQVFRRAEATMSQADDANTKSSQQLCLDAGTTYHSMRILVMLVIALTLLLSGLIGRLLTAAIAPPLVSAVGVLEAVAAKDLTQTATACGHDEIGRMTTALNTSGHHERPVAVDAARR
jgi:methyl-accepting chemotaxis protein